MKIPKGSWSTPPAEAEFENIPKKLDWYGKIERLKKSATAMPLVNEVLRITVPMLNESLAAIAEAHPYFAFTQVVDRSFTKANAIPHLEIPQGTKYVATKFRVSNDTIFAQFEAYECVAGREDEMYEAKVFECDIYNIGQEWGDRVAQKMIDGMILINNSRNQLFGKEFAWQSKKFTRAALPFVKAEAHEGGGTVNVDVTRDDEGNVTAKVREDKKDPPRTPKPLPSAYGEW